VTLLLNLNKNKNKKRIALEHFVATLTVFPFPINVE
jgi:hypothetical protein